VRELFVLIWRYEWRVIPFSAWRHWWHWRRWQLTVYRYGDGTRTGAWLLRLGPLTLSRLCDRARSGI